MIVFIENYQRMIYKTNLAKYFPFTVAPILCRFSYTGIKMTSQRRFYACDPQNFA